MVAAPFIRQVNPRMERSNWVMLVCLSVDVDTPFSPKLKQLTFKRLNLLLIHVGGWGEAVCLTLTLLTFLVISQKT